MCSKIKFFFKDNGSQKNCLIKKEAIRNISDGQIYKDDGRHGLERMQ